MTSETGSRKVKNSLLTEFNDPKPSKKNPAAGFLPK